MIALLAMLGLRPAPFPRHRVGDARPLAIVIIGGLVAPRL
jgi:hypothetical protein